MTYYDPTEADLAAKKRYPIRAPEIDYVSVHVVDEQKREAFKNGALWQASQSAPSSQGLTFRWEGEFLYIGNFAFAQVYSNKDQWFVWINGQNGDIPVESEKHGGEVANEKAKAFIAKLEGRE